MNYYFLKELKKILKRSWGVEFTEYIEDNSSVYFKIMFHYISILVLFSFMKLDISDFLKFLRFQGDPV